MLKTKDKWHAASQVITICKDSDDGKFIFHLSTPDQITEMHCPETKMKKIDEVTCKHSYFKQLLYKNEILNLIIKIEKEFIFMHSAVKKIRTTPKHLNI